MGNNSDDDSDFAEYGTALEAIEEDEVARKKPITVAEQVAVDERGRRRFHGAFTGGFSAGYFNTVGSKEGWAPATFKSSRGDRAAKGSFTSQNVLDFMDEEDKGAFGIAPQILRPTDDFTDKNDSRTRKRPLAKQSEGPIPGVPVLEQIIQPVKETVGIRILIKMGWRPGKGVGPKVQRKAKKPRMEPDAEIIQQQEEFTEHDDNDDGGENNRRKMYGCFLPPELTKGGSDDSNGSEDLIEAEELLAPDDVSSLLCNPKENSFGLGYKGLDRNALTSTSSHVDLFGGAKLKFRMENKHLSISGEAFGVGAFEDNDEDIYSREDMSQYDFALETPEEKRRRRAKEEQNKRKGKNKENCIEGFKLSSSSEKLNRKEFPPPTLPPNFEPFHVVKKSRFELTTPTVDITEKQETAAKGLGRHNLTISERQVLIEEDVNKVRIESKEAEDVNTSTTKSDDGDQSEKISDPDPPVQSKQQQDADIQYRIERLRKFTQVLQAYTSNKPDENQKATFKPFMKNPEKQERYEKYMTLLEAGFSECLRDLQPPEMADWERQREKMEFDRASKLYKPMNSILSSRFTSAKSHDISHLEVEREAVKEKDPKDDPKVAAKMKLFGKLTHRIMEWHPDKLVCKRFNVPHPYPDSKFVGVKGDPSNRQASSSSVTSATALVAALPAPKKSLFANLDFSKPPPGLLPPGTTMPPSSTNSPMDSSEEAGGKPILAFQKELSSKAADDDAEIVPSEAVRPPLDLFKEIFADSSDESEEEDTGTPQPSASLQMNPGKKNDASQHSKSGHLPDKSPAIASGDKASGSDKILSSHYGRKSFFPENERANQKATPSTASYLRRVFDRIDLDKLQDHAHVPGKRSDNEQLSDTILRKSNNDEDNGEEEDMYGPLPPRSVSPSSNNASSSRQDPLKPMFIPRGSSKVTPPVSSTVMNYKLPVQGKSQDERTKDGKSEEVVWIEKSALSDRSSRSRVKSKKRSSSAKKSRRKSSKKEKEKHKSHKSSKSKKQKHKKKGKGSHKSKGKHSHRRESSSGSGSSSGSDEDNSGASSDSSVTINDSLDNRALLAKLKKITRSN